MDGLPTNVLPISFSSLDGVSQRTLKTSIDCVGIGLHGGARARLVLRPAAAGTGLVFRRTDLAGAPSLRATYDNVIDTRLCTVLGDPANPELRVGTVEHVLAALAGLGVTNAIIEVDGAEVPILDGSSENFVFLIECAGIADQDEAGVVIEVLRPVRVTQGDAFAELRPASDGLDLAMSIAFDATAIGRQALSLRLTPASFRSELAFARTFTQSCEIERLREAGLALGGSLANAVVVDGARVLNPAGLRAPDEFVRHKMLDVVGDLALAGGRMNARFVGHRSGHALNNRLLRALFADASQWRMVEGALSWATQRMETIAA